MLHLSKHGLVLNKILFTPTIAFGFYGSTAKTSKVHQLQQIFVPQFFWLRFSFYFIFILIGICQLDNDV